MYRCDAAEVRVNKSEFVYLLMVGGGVGVGGGGCFFFNDTATTEIYTRSLVGSVRCV